MKGLSYRAYRSNRLQPIDESYESFKKLWMVCAIGEVSDIVSTIAAPIANTISGQIAYNSEQLLINAGEISKVAG
jgi:hypothetical protein